MPYILSVFAGKKTAGGYIRIDGGTQIQLQDGRVDYISEGLHHISFSSISGFQRGLNKVNLYTNDGSFIGRANATMAINNEMKAVDGEITETFYPNSMLVLNIISDGSCNVISLPQYEMRELNDEEIKKVEDEYRRQCEEVDAAYDAYLDSANVTELLLCLFLGGLGAHKFYRKKYGMGILYLFTAGLFGIGVIVDLISIISKLIKKDKREKEKS